MKSYVLPDVEAFLEGLLQDKKFRENIVARQSLEPVEAIWADFPSQTRAELLSLLREQGVERLFEHQREAIYAALNGENLVISTGVASGKSLCYQFPILQEHLLNPTSRALLLFPTKALAQDQAQKMQNLATTLAHQNPKIPKLNCSIYDGDTASEIRSRIRNQAGLVFSNPDMLHLGILPNHTLWSNFFAHLRWVVIDEVHIYRGVFGSHFANVLRRLKRICALYGAQPQFVCTSATVANARELAEDLLESPVRLIDRDSSPHGRREFLIVNPPIVDATLGIRRSAMLESTSLAKRWLYGRGQAIIFCGPRRSVEILFLYLSGESAFKDRVRSYRSGYLAAHRREIEKELREGSIGLVVSTNALELGIDIGGIDAVFLNTYPGTISATRQQAGRAGRKGNTALAILVASANPLDQYICQNPSYLFATIPSTPSYHQTIVKSCKASCSAPFTTSPCWILKALAVWARSTSSPILKCWCGKGKCARLAHATSAFRRPTPPRRSRCATFRTRCKSSPVMNSSAGWTAPARSGWCIRAPSTWTGARPGWSPNSTSSSARRKSNPRK
jgi:DEAD/DEAH box helicase domain-containing protein